MSWNSRVVWSEGMFLRPQHFQQHDRFIENLVNGRCNVIRVFGWGVMTLTIDDDMLALGKIGISEARGVLPDGTTFSIPADDEAPPTLDVAQGTTETEVFLAVPVKRPGAHEFADAEHNDVVTRYQSVLGEVQDNAGADRASSEILLGKLHLALTTTDDQSGSFAKIPVARIVEMRSDGQVVLDDNFIPPCLVCNANARLSGFLTEILGLLQHRGEALAGRVTQAGQGGVSEFGDYLLLQVVNRYESLFAHFAEAGLLHPEACYTLILQLAGELATFTSENHRAIAFPVYDHDHLQACFTPVMTELRRSLSMVLDQTAVELPLEERRYGVRVAVIADRELVNAADLVLAVSGDAPTEVLVNQVLRQLKVGAVENIADLVNLQLPGVTIRQLPVAPRQIPYHTGYSYFELDKKSEYWAEVSKSGGIAIHVGSDIAGLDLHLWAIRK